MGRIKIKVRLAAAGIVRLDRPEGWAGNEGGQDADPPVHAARAQDVLQLNGAEGIARRFTHMPMSGRGNTTSGWRTFL